MRGLHLCLLAVLLWSERALSLRCYTCADMESSSPCHPTQCLMQGVCYSSNMTLTMGDGKQVKYRQKGCVASCDEASRIMEQLSRMNRLDVLDDPGLMHQAKLEMQGLACCEKDLCNGGAPPLGPGGGLLLSLGPVLRWALL